jgi:cytochrome c553
MRIVSCLFSMMITLGIASLACGEAGPPAKAPESAETPNASPDPKPVVVAQAQPESTPMAHHEGAAGGEFACISGDVKAGETQYKTFCESCHGPGGNGEGPAAAALDPKPAKHNDGGYMNALTNDHLKKVIAEGGAAVGKSPLMAPWGGVLNEQQVMDVVAYVRSLADPPYSCPE